MTLRNYIDKLKRYFWFTKQEFIGYALSVIGLTIIYAYPRGNYLILEDVIKGLIFVAITVFVHHAGQRMWALRLGFRAEQNIWWNGILIGLIISFVSSGKLTFLAATATLPHLLPVHRLGAFRYGPNMVAISSICLWGPLFNLFFSAVIKTIEWLGLLNSALAQELFLLNITFAVCNLLPIPPLDGAKIFYASRLSYILIFSTLASYILLIYLLGVYSYLLAILFGILGWLIYYITIEKNV